MYNNMGQRFQNHQNARIIAYIELVVSVISGILNVAMFVGAIICTVRSVQDYRTGLRKPSVGFVVTLWIAFVFDTLTFIIELMAVLKLLDATRIGKDACEGAKQCRFWRNVTIVFTVLRTLASITFLILTGFFGLIGLLIDISYHFCAIFIVQKFITELDDAAQGVLPRHQAEIVVDSVGMVKVNVPMPPQAQKYGFPSSPPNYDAVVNEKIPF